MNNMMYDDMAFVARRENGDVGATLVVAQDVVARRMSGGVPKGRNVDNPGCNPGDKIMNNMMYDDTVMYTGRNPAATCGTPPHIMLVDAAPCDVNTHDNSVDTAPYDVNTHDNSVDTAPYDVNTHDNSVDAAPCGVNTHMKVRDKMDKIANNYR